MKSSRLGVLVLGAAVTVGCKFPAFEGSDICSGLAVGDLIEVHIDGPTSPNGGTPTECDSQLGFVSGALVVAGVASMGEEGCGLATGPFTVQNSRFTYEFDPERSLEVGDARAHHWVNASFGKNAQCTGDLVVRLENVVPELVGTSNSGELSVRYSPREERADCPTRCSFGFSVQISKRAESS